MVAARQLSTAGDHGAVPSGRRAGSIRSEVRHKLTNAPLRLRRRQRELALAVVQQRDRVDRRWEQPWSLPLRVVIPVGPDDVDTIGVCVAALRRNLLDEIRSVILVAPAEVAEQLARMDLSAEIVDEVDVVGREAIDIVHASGSGGWIVQQIVKLSVDRLGDDVPILCVDADTVLVRPQAFREGERIARLVMALNLDGYHRHLRNAFRGTVRLSPFGYVAHQMVFEPEVLRAFRSALERLNGGTGWVESLLLARPPGESDGFSMSEFELYGHFNHRNRVSPLVHRAWRNRPALRTDLAGPEALERRWGPTYRSVSFHHHLTAERMRRLLTAEEARR